MGIHGAALWLLLLLSGLSCTANPKISEELPSGGRIDRQIATTGQVPQTIRIYNGIAYIVNSGANSVQRLDLRSGENDKAFITLPLDSAKPPPNPWGLAIAPDPAGTRGYLTANRSNSLYLLDLDRGSILMVLSEGFATPQEALVHGDRLFVSNSNYEWPDWGPGHISVIDRVTLKTLAKLPTSQKNPQAMTIVGDLLLVVNSGPLEQRDDRFFSLGGGGLDAFSLTDLGVTDQPLFTIPLVSVDGQKVDAPLSVAVGPSGRYAYLGSATDSVLYKIDLQTRRLLRGPGDPIRYDHPDGNALTSVYNHPSGLLLLLSFNSDQLLVFDPSADQLFRPPFGIPIELGVSADLEGPADLALQGTDVIVIMGISNKIVGISWPE